MSKIIDEMMRLAKTNGLIAGGAKTFTDDDVYEFIAELDSSHFIPPARWMVKLESAFNDKQRNLIAEKINSIVLGGDASRVGMHALMLMSLRELREHNPENGGFLADVFYALNPDVREPIIERNHSFNKDTFNILNESIFAKSPLTNEDFKNMFYLSGYIEVALGVKAEKPMDKLMGLREKLDSNGLGDLSQALECLAHGKPIELGAPKKLDVQAPSRNKNYDSDGPSL